MTKAAKKRAFVRFCIQCADFGREFGRSKADTVILDGRKPLSLKQYIQESAATVFDNLVAR